MRTGDSRGGAPGAPLAGAGGPLVSGVAAAPGRTRVELPPAVTAPFEVYLNGVLQEAGRDYRVQGRTLVFERPLAREGRLSAWRWLSMLLGIAGTYHQNDAVDVVYTRGGRRTVATGLPLEPIEPPA